MTLYNFFTKPTADPADVEALRAACERLRPLCLCIVLSQFDTQYSLVGQMLGGNTTAGDPDLLDELLEFGYTWHNAHNPQEQATYGWD